MFRCGVLQSRPPSDAVVLVQMNAPCRRWLTCVVYAQFLVLYVSAASKQNFEMTWTLEHQTFVTQVLQMCICFRSCTVLERRTRCTYKALWVERKKQSITMVVCLRAAPTCWTLYHVAPESLWLQNPFIILATKKEWHCFPAYHPQVALVLFSLGSLSFFCLLSYNACLKVMAKAFFLNVNL